MAIKPSCFFWDGEECHYEPLFLGCQPCKECPPEGIWPFFAFTVIGMMIADVYLHSQGFTNVIYVIDWNYHVSRFVD